MNDELQLCHFTLYAPIYYFDFLMTMLFINLKRLEYKL